MFACTLSVACGGAVEVTLGAAHDAGADAASDVKGGDAAGGDGSIVIGSVAGASFGTVVAAYWITKPDPESLPTQIYLSEASLDCTADSACVWAKELTSTSRNLS